ncbi:MAG: hypothetical protein JSS56_23940, partial [Proteobacteria bacterium]|nr:hypothetical protein [Pseudomonadota bacterium]
LGKRVVTGDDAGVDAGQFLELKGTASTAPEQSLNEWSILPPLPEDELQLLRAKNAELTKDALESKHREEDLNKARETLRALVRDRDAELQAVKESSRLTLLQHQQWCDQMSEELRAECERAQLFSAELNVQNARIEELVGTALQMKERIQALLDSNSWRFTAPFRWGKLKFSRVFRRSN